MPAIGYSHVIERNFLTLCLSPARQTFEIISRISRITINGAGSMQHPSQQGAQGSPQVSYTRIGTCGWLAGWLAGWEMSGGGGEERAAAQHQHQHQPAAAAGLEELALRCAEQGEGWEWCETLRECVHGHVQVGPLDAAGVHALCCTHTAGKRLNFRPCFRSCQTCFDSHHPALKMLLRAFFWCACRSCPQSCPVAGGEGDDMGLGGGSSDELTALDGLLSSTPLKVSVAVLCLFVANEMVKSLLLRHEHTRRQAEQERLVTSASSPDTAAKADKWSKMQEEHKKLSEAAAAERKEEERQLKLIELEQKRKKYGLKDWKQAQSVGGDDEQEDVRARQVAEQDAAAPEREAALRDQADRAKAAKLKAIERQRKAYGLLPKGQVLAPRSDVDSDDGSGGGWSSELSIVEQQDAEYAAALAHDLQEQEIEAAEAAKAPQRRPAEPEPGEDVDAGDVTSVRFRLPSGAIVTRRFALDGSTASLFTFLSSSDAPEEMHSLPLQAACAQTSQGDCGELAVALWKAGFPRERIERSSGAGTGGSSTLREAGLAGGAVLTVELLT
eukprot:COSAG02_NODE_2386_length_8989_cov_6.465917_9_plen_557_part_00